MTAPPAGRAPLVLANTPFTRSALVDDLPLADPAKTWWTIADLAAHYDLKVQTIRVYRTAGKLPPEDGKFGQTPVWKPATIQKWKIPSKGQGYRSDLKDSE